MCNTNPPQETSTPKSATKERHLEHEDEEYNAQMTQTTLNMNYQQNILRELAAKENEHKGFSPTPKEDEAGWDRELITAQELLGRIIQKRLSGQGGSLHDERRPAETVASSKKGSK